MEWVMFLYAPLVFGACWGAWRGRRDRFSFVVLLATPFVSAILICGGMIVVGMLSGTAQVNPNNPNPLLVQWLASAVLLGPGIFVFGAVPAVLASSAGQFGKLWVVRRYSPIPRIEGKGK